MYPVLASYVRVPCSGVYPVPDSIIGTMCVGRATAVVVSTGREGGVGGGRRLLRAEARRLISVVPG